MEGERPNGWREEMEGERQTGGERRWRVRDKRVERGDGG